MNDRRYERGQVLPMWIVGVIATFSLMLMALNYGNAIRWQIRAQNAADSAAAAVVSIQAERWNMLMEMVYATGVEEYRTRRLLDGLLLATNGSGGCAASFDPTKATFSSVTEGTCNRTYIDLHDQFMRSVNRYSTDVRYVNDIANLATFPKFQQDATALMNTLQSPSCNTATPSPSATGGASPAPTATPGPVTNMPTCGDVAFKYAFSPVNYPVNGYAGMELRTGLNNVAADAQIVQFQYGSQSAAENANLFAPVRVDLTTCKLVPPIIPSFGPFHFASYYAIGRAAATDVMTEQDWLQPGSVIDHLRPGGDALFQPDEDNNTQANALGPLGGNGYPSANASLYDWYDVNFGGETATAYVNAGVFSIPVYTDQFDARTGWWGAVPIKPFGKTVTTATAC